MPKRVTYNCATGQVVEEDIVGAELTAFNTQLASSPLLFKELQALDRRVQTTTATPTEIYRATLALQTGYFGELQVMGVDMGNGTIKQITAHVLVKRLSAAAILVAAPAVVSSIQDTAASAWAINASVSGNDFIVTVTGAAGRTIEWSLTGSVRSFTPSGR